MFFCQNRILSTGKKFRLSTNADIMQSISLNWSDLIISVVKVKSKWMLAHVTLKQKYIVQV